MILVGAAGLAGAALWAYRRSWSKAQRELRQQRAQLEAELQHEQEKRQADRTGRTRAEKQLREMKKEALETGLQVHTIGTVESCFRQRRGTPRQPGVVTEARAAITLVEGLNAKAILDGLDAFSHVWVLYVFHENTNSSKVTAEDPFKNMKTKIRPPLAKDDLKVGCLACRSPHRPNPIGLSVARLVRVEGRSILLEGLDIIDGSPVLDIKPYMPQFDSITKDCRVPSWVQDAYADSATPLEVVFSPQAEAQWSSYQTQSVRQPVWPFDDHLQALSALEQTLAQDFRSPFQKKQAGDFAGELEFLHWRIAYAMRRDEHGSWVVEVQTFSDRLEN